MPFGSVNYLAVFIAAIAGWLTGAIWYSMLGNIWLKAVGRTRKDINKARGTPAFYVPFVVAIVANIVIAFVLYGVMRHVGPLTPRAGLISGAFVWFGFVLTTMATNNAFGGRKPMLTAIDGGHWLAVLLVIGGILGAFGG